MVIFLGLFCQLATAQMSQMRALVAVLHILTTLFLSRDKALNHKHHPLFKRLATIFYTPRITGFIIANLGSTYYRQKI